MRSFIHDVLPTKVRRSLANFGADLSVARRKHNLTIAMLAERLGVAKATYLRLEKGNPSVAIGARGFGVKKYPPSPWERIKNIR